MALEETIDYAHAKGMYVIGDIKRNDIGATATAHAEAYLGKTRVGDTEIAPYGCDSVTVNGYLGTDGVEPVSYTHLIPRTNNTPMLTQS